MFYNGAFHLGFMKVFHICLTGQTGRVWPPETTAAWHKQHYSPADRWGRCSAVLPPWPPSLPGPHTPGWWMGTVRAAQKQTCWITEEEAGKQKCVNIMCFNITLDRQAAVMNPTVKTAQYSTSLVLDSMWTTETLKQSPMKMSLNHMLWYVIKT